MLTKNTKKICTLLGTRLPIVQAGMIWVSGAKLAAAAANSGCLGLIGAGSMQPELLEKHIIKARSLTTQPFGVNVPLLYSKAKEQIDVALEHGVKIFFTSAGSPKMFTDYLKGKGATVVHVTTTPELALKCEKAGVDAIVAEGFEAGGHNGRDEITTMCLIPQVVNAVSIPVIAAGGIGDGRAVAAALALGAHGVQIGSRFVATAEASAHSQFKDMITQSGSSDTMLAMRKLVPVRLLKNEFYAKIARAEESGASAEELKELLGKGRAKAGMFEGDLREGELEIGQVSGLIRDILPVQEVVSRLEQEFFAARESLKE